jgi:hypothetical protein
MDFLNEPFTTAAQLDLLRAMSLLLVSLIALPVSAQKLPEVVEIPVTATALEGLPTVLVSSGEGGTESKTLSGNEATKNRLLVTIVNGRVYWASRGNRQLERHQSGAFTYLYEGPNAYIKFARVGNKIVYLEHGNIFLSTLTYWGEMKIITGR